MTQWEENNKEIDSLRIEKQTKNYVPDIELIKKIIKNLKTKFALKNLEKINVGK